MEEFLPVLLEFTGNAVLNIEGLNDVEPVDLVKLFLMDELLEPIVEQTKICVQRNL